MYYIASVKNTSSDTAHISFWGPNWCGYVKVINDGHTGEYTEEDAAKLNDGIDCIAVPVEEVKKLLSPEPYYKPGARFYDTRGQVVDNTRKNWNALIKERMPTTEPQKVKHEVFKGKRVFFTE